MHNYATYFNSSPNSEPTYEVVKLGKLYVPSGKIYCCDPFLSHEVSALDKTVKAGYYTVKLSLVKLPDWGKRVALAAVVFANQESLHWLKATHVIHDETFTGFRVDSGMAAFMDLKTAEMFSDIIDQYYEKNPDGNYYDDILAAEFRQNADPARHHHIGDWNLHHPVEGDQRNIAMFASGLGDGVYSAYWGVDDNGLPAMLVADFNLL